MKKFSAIIICLLMIVTCSLAGCATFSIDKVKYYNEVLAKVGDTNITRFEVLNAYNSYGNSYYVQQMGKEESEAIESTLDLLIDRESLYQYALTDAKFKPSARQVNKIIEEMFSSMDEQMDEYVSTAKSILNIKTTEDEKEESDDEKTYPYKDYVYTPRASLVPHKTYYTNANKTTVSSDPTDYFTTTYSISYILPEDEEFEPIISQPMLEDHTQDGVVEAIRTEYMKRFQEDLTETEKLENVSAIKNKALDLLAADLMSYEKYLLNSNGKHYNKVKEDLIYRYFERNFESQIKSQYLENVRTNYLENETLSVDLIMDKFESLMTSSYTKYVNRQTTYKNKMKSIGTAGDSVLYHPATKDGTKFGYFIHTLINFTEDQKTNIKLLDEDDSNYESDYADIVVNQTNVDYRDNEGKVAGQENLVNIVKEYQTICEMPNYDDRLNAFIQFMFKYTGDTATLSAGMPYVVGTNGFSSMVEEFTDESIALMEKGVGSMSEVNLSNLDSLCITTYGIHFVFYVESVDAYDFDYDSKDSVKIEDLLKTINPLTNESYFDMIFDAVYPASGDEEVYTSNNGYTSFENRIVEDMKAVNKVVKFKTKIENTKTSF